MLQRKQAENSEIQASLAGMVTFSEEVAFELRLPLKIPGEITPGKGHCKCTDPEAGTIFAIRGTYSTAFPPSSPLTLPPQPLKFFSIIMKIPGPHLGQVSRKHKLTLKSINRGWEGDAWLRIGMETSPHLFVEEIIGHLYDPFWGWVIKGTLISK